MKLTQLFDGGHAQTRLQSRRSFGFGPIIIFYVVLVVAIAVRNANGVNSKPAIIVTSIPVHATSTSASVSVSSTVSSSAKSKPKKYVVVADKEKGKDKVEESASVSVSATSSVPQKQTWDSWMPMPAENITMELLMPTPNTTPLTVVEQEKRLAQMNSFTNKKKQELASLIEKDKKMYQHSAANPIIVGNGNDKWGLDALRDQAFNYVQMLLDNFVSGVQSTKQPPPPPAKGKSRAKSHPLPPIPSSAPGSAGVPVSQNSFSVDQTPSASSPVATSATPYNSFGHYGPGHVASPVPAPAPSPASDPLAMASNIYSAAQAVWPAYHTAQNIYSNYGGEAKSVVNWLARLIGVSGKTLGEFLREYQVHVLYDLVFTFFKWIFFLYAGLLIP